jgi:hypothetical protein
LEADFPKRNSSRRVLSTMSWGWGNEEEDCPVFPDAREKYHLPIIPVSAQVKVTGSSVLVAKMIDWPKSTRLCEAICRYVRTSGGLACALDEDMNFLFLEEKQTRAEETISMGAKHLTGSADLSFDFETVQSSEHLLQKLIFGIIYHQLEKSGWYKIGRHFVHDGRQIFQKESGHAHCVELEVQLKPMEGKSGSNMLLHLGTTCSVHRFVSCSKTNAPEKGDMILTLPGLSEVKVIDAHEKVRASLPKHGALQRKNLERGYIDSSPQTLKELERWWKDNYGMVLPSLSSNEFGSSSLSWAPERPPIAHPNCCLLKSWLEVRRESRLGGGNASHVFLLLRKELARIKCLSNILPAAPPRPVLSAPAAAGYGSGPKIGNRDGNIGNGGDSSSSSSNNSSGSGGSSVRASDGSSSGAGTFGQLHTCQSRTIFATGSGVVVPSPLNREELQLKDEQEEETKQEAKKRKMQEEKRQAEEARRLLPKKQVNIMKKASYAKPSAMTTATTAAVNTHANLKTVTIKHRSKANPSSLFLSASSKPFEAPSMNRKGGSLLQKRSAATAATTTKSQGSGSGSVSSVNACTTKAAKPKSTPSSSSSSNSGCMEWVNGVGEWSGGGGGGDSADITAKIKAHRATNTLSKLKVPELKDFLRLHKQPLKGKKDEIVERVSLLLSSLADSDSARMPPPALQMPSKVRPKTKAVIAPAPAPAPSAPARPVPAPVRPAPSASIAVPPSKKQKIETPTSSQHPPADTKKDTAGAESGAESDDGMDTESSDDDINFSDSDED